MKGLRRWMGDVLLLWALGGWVVAVQACTTTETNIVTPTVTSFRINGGAAVEGTGGNANFRCGSVALVLGSNPTLKGTILENPNGRFLRNGAFSIPYQVTSPGGTVYAPGAVVVDVNGGNLLTLLGSNSATVPLRVVTVGASNVPAGMYTDTIYVRWDYNNICEGALSILGACAGTVRSGSTDRPVTVQLTVTNDCAITAPALAFGTAPLVGSFVAQTGRISLRCTRNMVYSVGLGQGSYYNSTTTRRQMASGSNRLAYDLFKPGTGNGVVWTATGTGRVDVTTAADGVTLQELSYGARIYTDQATPAPGAYTDSVVVDVQF